MFELENLKDFLGSKKSINLLKTELENNNYSGFYYIYGKRGIGKSTLIRLICEENNIAEINLELTTKETRKSALGELMKSSLIKRALVLDNIDLTNKVGKYKYKKFLDFIIKKQDKMKKNLIFMIGEKKKFLKTFQKLDMNPYMISRPRDSAILKLLKEIIINNNYETTTDRKLDLLLEPYIKEKQGNLKSILVNLEFFLSNLEKVSYTRTNKEMLSTTNIDKDKELFSIIGGVFHQKDFSKRCDIYYNNTFMIPHFVYENFPKYITKEEDNITKGYKEFIKTTNRDKKQVKEVYERKLMKKGTVPYHKLTTTMGDFDVINEIKMHRQFFSLEPYLSAFSCGFTKEILGEPESQMLTFPRKIKLANKNNLWLEVPCKDNEGNTVMIKHKDL